VIFSRRSSTNPLRHAGASAEEIAFLRFITGSMFEMTVGDLGIALSVFGVYPDCCTNDALYTGTNRRRHRAGDIDAVISTDGEVTCSCRSKTTGSLDCVLVRPSHSGPRSIEYV
jgi:hypothetical protein